MSIDENYKFLHQRVNQKIAKRRFKQTFLWRIFEQEHDKECEDKHEKKDMFSVAIYVFLEENSFL